MLASVKPHREEGIVRPRAVAHSIQVARLLAAQKRQSEGQLADNLPSMRDAYLIGSLLYFMLERIQVCQRSEACDPSRISLYHWVDDTLRRAQDFHNLTATEVEQIKTERGNIVVWLQKQTTSNINHCIEVLQSLSPYDFSVMSVPQGERMITLHVQLLSHRDFISFLKQLLQQYLSDGLKYMDSYASQQQFFEMRLFMRHISTMRAIARGFGEAALLNKDYLSVAESLYFSGDLALPSTKHELENFLAEAQNEYPETCDTVLQALQAADTDWFDRFKQIYRDLSSSGVPTKSVR